MTLLTWRVNGTLNVTTAPVAPLELKAQTVIIPAQRPRRLSRKRTLIGFIYGCVVKQGYGIGLPKRVDDIGAGVRVTLAVNEDGAR